MYHSSHDSDLETEVQSLGRILLRQAHTRTPQLYRGIHGLVMRRVMRDNALRDALFQFIDALPQLRSNTSTAEHYRAYLSALPNRDWFTRLLKLGGNQHLAWLVRYFSGDLAHSFMVEEKQTDLYRILDTLQKSGATATLDAIGEAVLSEKEAQQYLQRNLKLLEWMAARGQRPHLSIKLTALTPVFDPLDPTGTQQRVFQRIAPLMDEVIRTQATLTIDMEQFELKPLILQLFIDMLDNWDAPSWLPSIALQAYLPSTSQDLDTVLNAAQKHGRKLGVRLVKGAYWEQECAWADERGWPVPVFTQKSDTDGHFEHLASRLFENADSIFPSLASHNLRSQSVALALAQKHQCAPDNWESQMLYGMAEPLRDALLAQGSPLRVYLPVGEPISGIAYLIRRLMENTASTSTLRQSYVEQTDPGLLLAPPKTPPALPDSVQNAGFQNCPLTDFSLPTAQTLFKNALNSVRQQLNSTLTHTGYDICNPAAPSEVLARISLQSEDVVDIAVNRARAFFRDWRNQPVNTHAKRLRRAATLISERRHELAALQVLEVGKNWREADADVAEAIDFMNYYADQAETLNGWHETRHFACERNQMRYEPRGVAAIISPWNFPLAILAGMSSAALAAGNCVIMKPSRQALLSAIELQRIYMAAGFPPEACQLLLAQEGVGARLAGHPHVHIIAFTGSRRAGLEILQAAHTPSPEQRHVKQVVCEMGGKNAIIVDEGADLDLAIEHILQSAFGFQGQKCSAASRLILVGDLQDIILPRLADALSAQYWGPPEDPRHRFGPMVSEKARDKARHYLEIGKEEGELYYLGVVPDEGWHMPPAIFTGIKSNHRLAQEEVFGPILAVLQADSFSDALTIAQESDYALTGGVFTRLPAHLELAQQAYRVGNLYLNRKTTGARVSVQPFGGIALSGTGIQAGGPDYIKQFMWSRVVSINTFRHGFLPSGE